MYPFISYLFKDSISNTLYKSPTSHNDNLTSIPSQVMRDLLRTKWHWAVLLRVIRLPLTILILPATPRTSVFIIRGWCTNPSSGPRTKWALSYPTIRIKEQLATFFSLILSGGVRLGSN